MNAIQHVEQEKLYSCGAAVYKMIINALRDDITEEQARKECSTTNEGTNLLATYAALKKRNIPVNYINLNQDFGEYQDILINISKHFPIIASGIFRSRKHTKGRDNVRYHAVLFADGVAYDPAENQPIDMGAYEITFNKKLTIRDILIIEEERPDFGKNRIE